MIARWIGSIRNAQLSPLAGGGSTVGGLLGLASSAMRVERVEWPLLEARPQALVAGSAAAVCGLLAALPMPISAEVVARSAAAWFVAVPALVTAVDAMERAATGSRAWLPPLSAALSVGTVFSLLLGSGFASAALLALLTVTVASGFARIRPATASMEVATHLFFAALCVWIALGGPQSLAGAERLSLGPLEAVAAWAGANSVALLTFASGSALIAAVRAGGGLSGTSKPVAARLDAFLPLGSEGPSVPRITLAAASFAVIPSVMAWSGRLTAAAVTGVLFAACWPLAGRGAEPRAGLGRLQGAAWAAFLMAAVALAAGRS